MTALVGGRPSLALAPDGWTLAFTGLDTGGTNLYLRGAGDFDARRLPGTEGAANPAFSPDGKTLAFLTSAQLKIMAVDGGSANTLGPASDPRGVTWADKDTLVYSPESIGGLSEISVRGGARRAITTLDERAGERTHRWPDALPGGRWILFTVGTTANPDDYDDSRIDAVDRQTGQRRKVFEGGTMARYAPTGHLVFMRGGSLYAVRFDPATLALSGQPAVVLQGVGGDPTTGAAHAAWSDAGTFAYVPGDAQSGLRHLVWVDFKGARQAIPLPPALYNDIRIAPDGTRVALSHGTSGLADIWVYALARGTSTRLTFTGVNTTPIWSADGREIFFVAVDKSGGSTVFKTSGDGGHEPVAIASTNNRMYLKYVSPDASWAIVDYIGVAGARANVGRLALKTGATVEPIVLTKSDEYGAAISPNGRFLAYQADADGRPEVYVRALDQPSGRWQISNAGGEEPMWSPDGRSLYYRFERELLRVPIVATEPFQPGLPTRVFDDVYNLRSDTGISYQPHPDGTRVLMIRPPDVTSVSNIRVITGWFDELRKVK